MPTFQRFQPLFAAFRPSRERVRLAALLFACAAAAPPVYAQMGGGQAPGVAEEGLRRLEEQASQRRQPQAPSWRLSPVLPVLPAPDEDIPQDHPCARVSVLRLEGEYAPRFGWLADVAAPWLGRCLGAAGLRQLTGALDRSLLELGYSTSRVTLPLQDVKDGVLTVRLHAGRVEAVQMRSDDDARSPDRNWGSWWNAFPLGVGDLLNLYDLEQGLEQMRRLPGQEVRVELAPGSEPDSSMVLILRRPAGLAERLRAALFLDNSGSGAAGRAQLSTQAALAQPLGLSDLLSLSGNTNLADPGPDRRSQSFGFDYGIPWGYHGFRFSQSYSRFSQPVQGTTVRFLSRGKSVGAQLRWDYQPWRRSASAGGVYLAVATRRASSYIDDVELEFQRRRTTSLEGGIAWRLQSGAADLDFQLGYRQGGPWQGAQQDLPSAAEGGPTLRPRLWSASATLGLPFSVAGRAARYSLNARGQHSRDMALAIDQIAIGNRFTVRGFDGETVLMGESGYFLRNEWGLALRAADRVNLEPYFGLDAGRVWGAAAPARSWLAGAALGMRAAWGRWKGELALAAPLHRPPDFPGASWNAYFSLGCAF